MEMNFLTSASVIMTDRCNLNCSYCYEKENTVNLPDMTVEMGRKIVDFLINQAKLAHSNMIYITFFGGEPTLNVGVMDDMLEYACRQAAIEKMKVNADLVTNGTTPLTGNYLMFLEHWMRLTDVNIQLSIDGLPEAQDKHRIFHDGRGSMDIIKANIESYKILFGSNFNDIVSIRSTITLETLNHVFESYKYFVEELGIYNIQIMPVHEENWMNSKGDHQQYEGQIAGIVNYINNQPAGLNNFDNILLNGFNITGNCRPHLAEKPCGAGYNFCTIDSNGDIYPCHRFRTCDATTKIGNIKDPLELIDANRKFYIEYTSDMMIGKYSCADCDNGSCYRCIAANYQHNGNMLLGFPKHCDMELVHQKIVKELQRHNRSEEKSSENDIQELANALTEIVVPLNDFIESSNKKMDTIIEMNVALINMVKYLLEKEKSE